MLMMGSLEVGARTLGLAVAKLMFWWMFVGLKRVVMELRVEREVSLHYTVNGRVVDIGDL
jgi:hypothetical protein